jgi:hypothetical protein
MGLNYGDGATTNGEARTMAAITNGVDPTDVEAFVTVVVLKNRELRLATDECADHATHMLVVAINHIMFEAMADPEGNTHDW